MNGTEIYSLFDYAFKAQKNIALLEHVMTQEKREKGTEVNQDIMSRQQ